MYVGIPQENGVSYSAKTGPPAIPPIRLPLFRFLVCTVLVLCVSVSLAFDADHPIGTGWASVAPEAKPSRCHRYPSMDKVPSQANKPTPLLPNKKKAIQTTEVNKHDQFLCI